MVKINEQEVEKYMSKNFYETQYEGPMREPVRSLIIFTSDADKRDFIQRWLAK